MLTTLKERLSDLIARKVSSDEFHAATELAGPVIPADIGHFLGQTLERRAGLEAKDLLRFSSPWFDFESAPIRHTVIEFITSLARQARFPQADFEHALERAVSTCCDYLIHPVNTLVVFSIPSSENANTEKAVLRRASYFLHYPYILEGVQTYLSRTQEEDIERSGMANHLRRIDEEKCASMTTDDWMQLFSPLIAATKLVFSESGGVPVELITAFMEEKQANTLLASVREAGERTGEFLSTADLDAAIRSVLEPKIEERPIPPEVFDTPDGPIPPEVFDTPDDTGSGATKDLPLWKQFAGKDQNSTSEAINKASAEPLWKSYQTGVPSDTRREADPRGGTPKPKPESTYVAPEWANSAVAHVSDESGLLGDSIQLRSQFIRELFGGDEREYLLTIDRLSAVLSWHDASSILTSDVFRRHQVDIYSETAVAFTNAVENGIKQLN